MTKMCKEILETLKNTPEHTLYYFDLDDCKIFTDETEFFDAVRYLESQGLIEYVSGKNGNHLGIHASHVAMHPIQLGKHSFLHWLFRDYLGGVIIGITTTLATEFALYWLYELFLR